MDITKPYDPFFKPVPREDSVWIFSVLAEKGFGNAKSFNTHEKVCSPLRIWQDQQDAIAMLQGFSENSPQGQLLDVLQGVDVSPIDNGTRGHFCVDGNLKLNYSLGFSLWRCLPYDFSIAAYLPFYSMQLRDVCWRDLTNPELPTDADVRVKNYLTNNFFANVCALGNGLFIGDWKRSGFGDLTFLLEWIRDFPQQKPILKNVRLNARLGPSLPTGLPVDENKLFARSFGNDGAMGLIYGGSLTLTYGTCFQAGFDVQLQSNFGNTRVRRIKTNVNQTELLLLEKTCVFKDWGLTQQINLFAQALNFFKGWSFFLDYQFFKHGTDHLSVVGNDFSSEIANTARSLEDWTAHTAIIKFTYDFEGFCGKDAWVIPSLSIYGKLPFEGKRSALFTTAGIILAFDF